MAPTRGAQTPRGISLSKGESYAVLRPSFREPPPCPSMAVRESARSLRGTDLRRGRCRPSLQALSAGSRGGDDRQARGRDQRVRLRAGVLQERAAGARRLHGFGIDAETTLKNNRAAFDK